MKKRARTEPREAQYLMAREEKKLSRKSQTEGEDFKKNRMVNCVKPCLEV